MSEQKKGYVYIFTNPCFKESWIKIGKTDNIERRLADLSGATGVPLPFEMYATLKTTKYHKAETMIHKMIGVLSPDKRVNPKREFFNIEPDDAVIVFKDIAELIDDAEFSYGEKITTQKTIDKGQIKRSPIKTFSSMGLKNGDVIEFVRDPQFKAVVSGDRTVSFENKEWLLSPLAWYLCEKIGQHCGYGSGFEAFRYDNKDSNIYTRWDRMNNKNYSGYTG